MATLDRSQQPLSSRIIGSAKGLACSTFSGVVGIEAELRDRDPLGVGKRITPPTQAFGRAVTSSDYANVSSRIASSASNISTFRSAGSNGREKEVEEQFRTFLAGKGLESFQNGLEDVAWSSRSGEQNGRQRPFETEMEYEAMDVDENELAWERSSKGEVVYDEAGKAKWDWQHEWKRLGKQRSKERLADQSRTQQQTNFELDLAEQMDHMELYQSVALARLEQIRQHLEMSDTQTGPLNTWKEDWHTHLERCDFTVEREEDQLPTPEEEPEEEPERYYFHCPWRECHHRLLRQNENLTFAIRQRACVHDGCGYVSQTVEDWLKHVTSAHHGLQQGMPKQSHSEAQHTHGPSEENCNCTLSESENTH